MIAEVDSYQPTRLPLEDSTEVSATQQSPDDRNWSVQPTPVTFSGTAYTLRSPSDESTRSPYEAIPRKRIVTNQFGITKAINKSGKALLQQWEGVVLEVDNETALCELHDLCDESNPVEIMEIYLEHFKDYDRPLLTEGTVFYWSVGYRVGAKGQLRNYSEIILRRVVKPTRAKLEQNARKVDSLLGRFVEQ